MAPPETSLQSWHHSPRAEHNLTKMTRALRELDRLPREERRPVLPVLGSL
jgi:hypothetical protein